MPEAERIDPRHVALVSYAVCWRALTPTMLGDRGITTLPQPPLTLSRHQPGRAAAAVESPSDGRMITSPISNSGRPSVAPVGC